MQEQMGNMNRDGNSKKESKGNAGKQIPSICLLDKNIVGRIIQVSKLRFC